jgi:hypothetical protein
MAVDMLGHEVNVGDIVVYTSCNETRVAIVRGISLKLKSDWRTGIKKSVESIQLAAIIKHYCRTNNILTLYNTYPRPGHGFVKISRSMLSEEYEALLVYNGY